MGRKDNNPPRSYFRLEYPKEVRPKISIDDGIYPVINLCEGGVKFFCHRNHDQLMKDPNVKLEAKITFFNSEETEVIGRIIRSDKDGIILALTEGISFQKIMAEQRFLLNKYGTLRRPVEES